MPDTKNRLRKLTGYHQKNITCPRCKGDGRLATVQGLKTCHICKGWDFLSRGIVIKRLKQEIKNIDKLYEDDMKEYLCKMLAKCEGC